MRLILIALFPLLALPASAQVTALPGQLFRWDQPTAEVATVDRFEIKIDSGAYVNAGKTPANNAQTASGMSSFSFVIPALSTGPHTFTVRACPASGACVESAPFAFGIVVISAPSNLRAGSDDASPSR